MLTLFYRNHRLLILTIGLIFVAGGSSLMIMPQMEDPLITPRAGSITTFFPGADAERVEALVTEKIEDELKEIEEIKQVRSTSRQGVSFLAIELRDEVNESQASNIWGRIRDKAADAGLRMPVGASKPDFSRIDVKAHALIVGLRWDLECEPNYAVLRRLIKQLKDRLDGIPGTEKSEIFGDAHEEILVTVRPEAAASLNLNSADLAQQILASDSKVAAGQLRGRTNEVLLEISGELETLTRVGHIPIQFGNTSNFVELSDIATIEKTIESPPASIVVLQNKPAIALGVLVRSESRLDIWSETTHKVIDEFKSELPPGVGFDVVFEQIPYVANRMKSLLNNLVFGGIAIFLVVLFMMGWRSAIIISTSLPLGCLAVLAVMHWLGIPIHQMSITGLIIALGMMIDNAIVMVDEISQKIDEGEPPLHAVSVCTSYLTVPLLGSTLTTVLSFGPIALMPGPSGEFVGSIAIVTILAITSTLILSLTVVAALAGMGLRPRRDGDSWLQNGWSNGLLTRIYKWLLGLVFHHPFLGAIASIALPVAGFWSAQFLPEQFFPAADRNQFQIELELPSNSSLAETQERARAIRELVLSEKGIDQVAWFLGESAPIFYYNVIPDRKNLPRYGQAIVDCQRNADIRSIIRRLQVKLDQRFPDATCLVRQLEQGPPFSAPIEFRLYGPDNNRLRELGEQVRFVLTETPNVILTRSELSESIPKLTFAVDEQQARLAGLSHASIAAELNNSLEGSKGGSILEATEELPIRVRVSADQRADLNKIATMDLLTRETDRKPGPSRLIDYQGTPLSAISSMRLDAELGGVNRLNGRPMNEVQAFITAGVLPSEVVRDFEKRLAKSGFQLPPGYTTEYGGAEAERKDAIGNLIANTSILIAMMIATLVLSFGSFRMAALIIVVAGLSVGLGLGSLWLGGYLWGFMSIVGIMGMIGVAINDSIVVIAALQNMPPELSRNVDAIREVLLKNTRHILVTTITTIAGFAPLIAGGGDFWPPVAVSISGGVGGATFLALFFVPCAYLLIYGSDRQSQLAKVA